MHCPAHHVLKEAISGRGVRSRPVAHREVAVKPADGEPVRDVACPRDVDEGPLVSGEYEAPTETPLLFVLPCDHMVIACN